MYYDVRMRKERCVPGVCSSSVLVAQWWCVRGPIIMAYNVIISYTTNNTLLGKLTEIMSFNLLTWQVYHTCITCVVFVGVLYMFRMHNRHMYFYIYNACVGYKPVLYMKFYVCNTCVGCIHEMRNWKASCL